MGTQFDDDRATEFLDQMRSILNHGMVASMIGIGHRVGLVNVSLQWSWRAVAIGRVQADRVAMPEPT